MKNFRNLIFLAILFSVTSGLKILQSENLDKKMQEKVLDIVQKGYWKYHDERSIAFYTTGTLYGIFSPKNEEFKWVCEFQPFNSKLRKTKKSNKTVKYFAVLKEKTGRVLSCVGDWTKL